MEIAVGDDQHVVSSGRKHVDKISDLAVRTVRRSVNHDGDVASGKAILQALYHGQRWIGHVLNPKDDLERRISLVAAGSERFVQQRFVAAQRLQDGDGRKPRWR
jgi:hypothetical protein